MTEGFVRRERDGVVWFTPTLLEETGLVRAAFSSRLGGVSPAERATLNLGLFQGDTEENVRENYRRFCRAIGSETRRVVLTRQVHRDAVLRVTPDFPPRGVHSARPYACDALITDRAGELLLTHHADCTPVFLLDPVRRAIGLAHAGWRGCSLQIARRTAEAMRKAYGSHPQDLLAAVGPCICPACFETDGDVPEAMRASMGEEAEAYLTEISPGRWRVDLAGLSALQLRSFGLAEANIARTGLCTCCRADLFYSHRRMGPERGTHAAAMELL